MIVVKLATKLLLIIIVLPVMTMDAASNNVKRQSKADTRAVAVCIYGMNRRYLKDATNF